MKTNAIILFLSLLVLGACVWENEEDLDAMVPDTPGNPDGGGDELDCSTITLSGDITPIIESSCAVPGCHGANRSPLMTSPDLIIAVADRILARTQAGTMPPSGPLPAADIEKIECWVNAGAPNN